MSLRGCRSFQEEEVVSINITIWSCGCRDPLVYASPQDQRHGACMECSKRELVPRAQTGPQLSQIPLMASYGSFNFYADALSASRRKFVQLCSVRVMLCHLSMSKCVCASACLACK